jgi:enamine deaminase RidA (YjgF/YER057c/UK114 family)
MRGRIAARLKELGIDLPKAPAPVANYVPWVRTGSLLFISGQLAMGPTGLEYTGTVGQHLDTEAGKRAARLAAINVVAQAAAALGDDLDRVVRVVKVTGYVSSASNFHRHPDVINGASDLFVDVFGDAGRHARVAVGASSLPRNSAVEVEAIFEIA